MTRRSGDWRTGRFCAVDLELTGIDARTSDVVSYAAIPIDGTAIRVGAARCGLVRPVAPVTPASARVHGLLDEDLVAAPPAALGLPDLFEAVGDRILVLHCAWIDLPFLRRAAQRAGLDPPRHVIDTAELAARWFGRDRRAPVPELGALALRLGLPVHRPHTADGDALTTAQVFLSLASRIDVGGRMRAADLLIDGSLGRSLRRAVGVRRSRRADRKSVV